jgi:GntR family transcriptional regulator
VLDQRSSQPLFQQLQARIREWIAQGDLHSGDRIPSEVILAKTAGISRMTVRHAIDQLVEEGVLYRQQSKGTYVAGLFTRRQGFISISFSRVIRSRGYAMYDQFLVRAMAVAPAASARDLDLAPGSEAVCIRRLRHVEGRPVMIETSWLAPLFESAIHADLATRSLHDVMEETGHMKLMQSEEYLWPAKVAEEDARLLGMAVGDPVFFEHGVVVAEGAVRARSTDLVLDGRYFRFSLTGGGGMEMRSPHEGRDGKPEWLPLQWWLSR